MQYWLEKFIDKVHLIIIEDKVKQNYQEDPLTESWGSEKSPLHFYTPSQRGVYLYLDPDLLPDLVNALCLKVHNQYFVLVS